MNELTLPIDCDDAAWASFRTPLDSNDLVSFCRDIHRLLRINPYLEFISWQALPNNCYHLEAINTSTQPAITLKLDIQVEQLEDGVRLTYSQGIKASTLVRIDTDNDGSKLSIIDSYNAVSNALAEQGLNEVDKSLVKWAEDLQRYLIRWHRWSRILPWRWYMQHIWLPMKPAARRITYMLLWISLVEVSLILLGAAIYIIEY